MTVMTGWQAVVQAIKSEGIRFVYGLPSSPEDLYDALYDEPSIKAIQVRHEAAGGFMAMAHAYRCYGERVEKPDDIRGALERALKANESGKPAILDIIIDPDDVAEGFIEYKKL